jgi:tRNA (guanine-N7-)-methyltransferase
MPRGKGKLLKYSEIQEFANVFEDNSEGFREFMNLPGDLVVELACGKAKFAVGLAQQFPEKRILAVDCKGDRIWSGAKLASELGLNNLYFLRTRIELLGDFFQPGDVCQVWITFPDPFPKDRHEKHRLTHKRFLDLYGYVFGDVAINLKTDSESLYKYSLESILDCGVEIISSTEDLHSEKEWGAEWKILTDYEKKFLNQGQKIKAFSFRIPLSKAKTALLKKSIKKV